VPELKNQISSQSKKELHSLLANYKKIGKNINDGIDRVALTKGDKEGRDYFIKLLKENNFEVKIDNIGNIFGLITFNKENEFILSGSHIDSQPNGGNFDGILGVLNAFTVIKELVNTFKKKGLRSKYNLAVVSWTNEEGARFQPSILGSSVYTGKIDINDAYKIIDSNRISVKDSLLEINYLGKDNFDKPAKYIETHVECGKILENNENQIGIINNYWGCHKHNIHLTGEQSHTGPTPMSQRKDALHAASLIITELKNMSDSSKKTLHTSVGKIDVYPNSPNVVPGFVSLFSEIRSPYEDALKENFIHFENFIKNVSLNTGIKIRINSHSKRDAGKFDESINMKIEKILKKNQIRYQYLDTIAAHDAVPLSKIVPSTVFVTPSVNGIIHDPKEYTKPEDLEICLDILYQYLYDECAQDEQ
jgi:N-carbamoyl-L-amino-acid hydrolase